MRARQKTKWGGVSEGWRSQESLQEALHSSTGAQILHRLPIGWVAGARDWKAMAPLKSGFCQARPGNQAAIGKSWAEPVDRRKQREQTRL